MYKIRLKNGRVLGPLDLNRIKELIRSGQISGTEQTSKGSQDKWRIFSSFPELADAFLAEIAPSTTSAKTLDMPAPEGAKVDEKSTPKDNPIMNNNEPAGASKLTATEALSKTNNTFNHPETPQNKKLPRIPKENDSNPESFADVPTIINIKPQANPDTERTKITSVAPTHRAGLEKYVSEATKIISTRQDMTLHPEKGEKKPIADTLGIKIQRRLLSKKTIYLLSVFLMISLYMTKQDEKVKDAVNDLTPKTFKFKPVQVNSPATPKDKKINLALSSTYLDKATTAYEKDVPVGYILAANLLYKAVFYNPNNVVAKSLLASSYIRLVDIIPRNEKFFTTISELLKVGGGGKGTPLPAEYFLAQSEFDLLLERPEKALMSIEAAVKKSPSPMLLYQQALLYRGQGERNKAISIITRALKMTEQEERNPRHLLLYAQLLDEKDQKGAALKVLKSFLAKHPIHGLGLYTYAKILYKSGDLNRAIKTLILLIHNPHQADPVTLANAFLLTARIFEAKHRYDKALQFANAGRILLPNNQEAEDLLFRIKSQNPSTKKLYEILQLAKEKEKSKEYTEAINLYIRARESDRRSPVPLFHLAQLYERTGKPQLAIELYKKITQMERKIIDVYFSLANLYLKQYEVDEAIALMRVAKSGLKKSTRITHMLGRIAVNRGDIPQSRAQFLAAIDAGSRVPQLYVDMASLESDRKEMGLAEFYYAIALRYDPYNEDALLGVALSRFFKNTPSDAIKFLESKLFARPNSPQILTSLALIHLKSGNRELGKQYLQRAVRSDPTYARAYKMMGNLVKEEGDKEGGYQEKRKSYKFALVSYGAYSKLAPNEPDGYMAAADLYFYVRDLGAAAKNYHMVLKLAPNYPQARLQLAKIARNGQDPETAFGLVTEEIKRHPNSSDAYVELGKIHLAKKEYALASQALTNSAKLNPKNTEAIIYLGYVHYLQGDYQSAIALFARALEIEPLKEDIHWKIGLAYEKQGKRAKAIAAFKNFQGLVSDPEKLEKVRARILKLQKQK